MQFPPAVSAPCVSNYSIALYDAWMKLLQRIEALFVPHEPIEYLPSHHIGNFFNEGSSSWWEHAFRMSIQLI